MNHPLDDAGDILFSAVCVYAKQSDPQLHRANLDIMFTLEGKMADIINEAREELELEKLVDQDRKMPIKTVWRSSRSR